MPAHVHHLLVNQPGFVDTGGHLAEPTSVGGWSASLALIVGPGDGRGRLEKLTFSGPLRVQKIFRPEKASEGRAGPCHLYLLHPPGGLVSGDLLDFDLGVASLAGALFTTPAATKIYRHRPGPVGQTVRTRLWAENGATLEWLPQGTIVFSGARADLGLSVELDPSARALGCDFIALGRPASNEGFSSGSFRQLTRIHRNGRLVFHELLDLTGGHHLLKSHQGLMGRTVMALFWALGRADQPEDLEAIKAASAILSSHESFGPRPSSAPGPVFSVTVRSGIFLARALTDSLDEAEAFRAQVWGVIRPLLLGRKPVAPYIWST